MLPGPYGLEYGGELADIREKFIAVMHQEGDITDDINQGSETMNQTFQRMLEPETDNEQDRSIDCCDFDNSTGSEISTDTSDLSFLSNLSTDGYSDSTSTTESSTGDAMEDTEVAEPPKKKIRKKKRERKQVAYFCY